MWGREARAGLLFVMVSLLAGGAIREWRRSHEDRFADLVTRLAEEDRQDDAGAATERVGTQGESLADSSAPGRLRADPGAAPAGPHAGRVAARPLRAGEIDLNGASARDLERLPGIGPALARRIAADRAARGPFATVDALRRVRGIGSKTLERLRPFLRAGPGGGEGGDSLGAN